MQASLRGSWTTVPPIRISPPSPSSRPATIRSRVVLPQPLGPSRLRNSPVLTSRLTSSRAVIMPLSSAAKVSGFAHLEALDDVADRHHHSVRGRLAHTLPPNPAPLAQRPHVVPDVVVHDEHDIDGLAHRVQHQRPVGVGRGEAVRAARVRRRSGPRRPCHGHTSSRAPRPRARTSRAAGRRCGRRAGDLRLAGRACERPRLRRNGCRHPRNTLEGERTGAIVDVVHLLAAAARAPWRS